MVHNSTWFTLKTLCGCVSLLESLVMTRVICHDSSHLLTRVNMRSSLSQVSHFTGDSSQVKNCNSSRLESESVTWLGTALFWINSLFFSSSNQLEMAWTCPLNVMESSYITYLLPYGRFEEQSCNMTTENITMSQLLLGQLNRINKYM